MNIRQPVLCFVMFVGILLLTSCGSAPQTESAAGAKATLTIAEPTLSPSQTPLPLPADSPTPNIELTLTSDAFTNPSSTPTPVVDTNGNVTWYPQQTLISWSEGGNDGNDYSYNHFTLWWDGELLMRHNDLPYTMHLSQAEVCKVLNTIETSGFFEEDGVYEVPYGGLGSEGISVNAWKTNSSGAQLLSSAILGGPYDNSFFCQDCAFPFKEAIIRPGLANTYYFLKNYRPEHFPIAPVKEILVQTSKSMHEIDAEWPLQSISFEQFIQSMKDCNEDPACGYQGKTFSGDMAQEIMEKISNNQVFPSASSSTGYIAITYQPKAPDVPPNNTLTCNTKTGHYPVLPLNPNNKFWYYAPGSKWGAEVVANENKIRVVNTSGYEKFYSYDAAFFGQASIQFYPRYWSKDGQFFYVNILPGEFKPNVSLVNSIGLEQIDVQNEKIKYLFLGTKGETFAYEFSTDRESVAYIRQGDDPLKLVIVNTILGEEHAVRLTRPDGTPYTSAGTLIWSAKDDVIYLAANYTENGTAKTDILGIHPDKLADLHILYAADKLITISKDEASSSTASICSLETGTNQSCLDLDIETGEVK